MIHTVPSKNPYVPENGDLIYQSKEANTYLEKAEDNNKIIEKYQIMPLIVIYPDPWEALNQLQIDCSTIKNIYKCPYTGYEHFGIVPIAVLSNNLLENYKDNKIRTDKDYVFDHEWHRHMLKKDVLQLQTIQGLLLGSGYVSGCSMWDGSPSFRHGKVNLNNGDFLFVAFCEWHNK